MSRQALDTLSAASIADALDENTREINNQTNPKEEYEADIIDPAQSLRIKAEDNVSLNSEIQIQASNDTRQEFQENTTLERVETLGSHNQDEIKQARGLDAPENPSSNQLTQDSMVLTASINDENISNMSNQENELDVPENPSSNHLTQDSAILTASINDENISDMSNIELAKTDSNAIEIKEDSSKIVEEVDKSVNAHYLIEPEKDASISEIEPPKELISNEIAEIPLESILDPQLIKVFPRTEFRSRIPKPTQFFKVFPGPSKIPVPIKKPGSYSPKPASSKKPIKQVVKKVVSKAPEASERLNLMLTKDVFDPDTNDSKVIWYQSTEEATSFLPRLTSKPISAKLRARNKPIQHPQSALSYYSQSLPISRGKINFFKEKTNRYMRMNEVKFQREAVLQQIYLGTTSAKYASHTAHLGPILVQQLAPTFNVTVPSCKVFSKLNNVHLLDNPDIKKLPMINLSMSRVEIQPAKPRYSPKRLSKHSMKQELMISSEKHV